MSKNALHLAICMVLIVAASAMADKPSKKPATLFKLPRKFVVHAVGISEGTTRLEKIRLDDSGEPVSQADVVVNLQGQPVVLVLTAYNPTVWNVGVTPDTEIAGIIVSGYHGQALVGVSKDIPAFNSTFLNRGTFEPFRANSASPELLAMNDTIKRLVGREMDSFVFQPQNEVFLVGEPLGDGVEPIYSEDRPLKGYAPEGPKARKPATPEDAIAKLVKSGSLRRATRDDIERWVDKASEPYARFNPELRVSHYMREGRTYVVLKKLTLPEGLVGGHSCDFIVPAGIAVPEGPPNHCAKYLMDGTVRMPGE
jgi:hypothetical protein